MTSKATKATAAKTPAAQNLGAALAEQVNSGKPAAAPTATVKSAKQFIRELLGVEGAQLTVAELCEKSGKTVVNITTALSDLRSAKYAGKAGVFATKSAKNADGKTVYLKA